MSAAGRADVDTIREVTGAFRVLLLRSPVDSEYRRVARIRDADL